MLDRSQPCSEPPNPLQPNCGSATRAPTHQQVVLLLCCCLAVVVVVEVVVVEAVVVVVCWWYVLVYVLVLLLVLLPLLACVRACVLACTDTFLAVQLLIHTFTFTSPRHCRTNDSINTHQATQKRMYVFKKHCGATLSHSRPLSRHSEHSKQLSSHSKPLKATVRAIFWLQGVLLVPRRSFCATFIKHRKATKSHRVPWSVVPF